MLLWHKELWLIDHGAALYFHYSWDDFQQQAERPFQQIKDHVLLKQASKLFYADEMFKEILTEEKIKSIVSLIPDDWLSKENELQTPKEKRLVYSEFLTSRINASEIFVNEANNARQALI